MRIEGLVLLLIAGSTLGVADGRAAVHTLDSGSSFTDVVASPEARAPKVDPLGKWAVYLADSSSDGREDLWSAHLAGGAPIPLSGDLGSGGYVDSFRIAPNGGFVAFVAAYWGETAELFIVPIGGGAATVKNHLLGQGEHVIDFAISPDSAWLAYRALVDDGTVQLFRVPSGAGSPAKYDYTDTHICPPSVEAFTIAPDSSRVAFRTGLVFCPNPDNPGSKSLWAALIGSTEADLAAATHDYGAIAQFEYTSPPVGQTPVLVHLFDYDGVGTTSPTQLHWYDGGTFGVDHVIHGTMVAGGNVASFATVPGSQFVVFLADREVDGYLEAFRTTAGVHSVVQIPVQLHEDLVTTLRQPVLVSPDGSRAVFVQEDNTIGSIDYDFLRSGSIASPGSSTLLDSIFVTGELHRFEIALDSSRVIYRAERNNPSDPFEPDTDRDELFSVPIGGGVATRLNPTGNSLYTTWDVLDFAVGADGQVRFVHDSEVFLAGSHVSQILLSPIAGGGATAVGPTIDRNGGGQFDDVVAPNRLGWAVSLGDASNVGRRQLYVSDACLFCDGFEGTGDGMTRWQ